MKKKVAKPVKEIVERWNFREVSKWLVQEGLWQEEDVHKIWDDSWLWEQPSNGSSHFIFNEDVYNKIEAGEEVTDEEKHCHELVEILFKAIGEDDYWVDFYFDW